MSNEALEFCTQLSHLEKSTLRVMANGESCDRSRATFLAELGLASGPDANGIYVLSVFGRDVLACCGSEPTDSSGPVDAAVVPESPAAVPGSPPAGG